MTPRTRYKVWKGGNTWRVTYVNPGEDSTLLVFGSWRGAMAYIRLRQTILG